jgi:hypothetical protein
MRAIALISVSALAASLPAVAQSPEISLPRQLNSPNCAPYDILGCDVAVLSADQVAVGLRGSDRYAPNAGAVEIFARASAGWTSLGVLPATGVAEGDQLGEVIAGGTDSAGALWLFAAAPRHDGAGTDAGAVWIYRLEPTGWKHMQTLLAAGAATGGRFGSAIATAGDVVAISAPAAGGGYVRLFQRSGDTWSQSALIGSPSANSLNRFGESIALAGDRLLVGDPNDDVGAYDGGAVFVFQRAAGAWSLQQTLRANQPAVRGNYGQSIAAHSATVAIGMPGASVAGTDGAPVVGAGRVDLLTYVSGAYEFSTSVSPAPERAIGGGNFGWEVALEKNLLIVGIPGDTVTSGAVTVGRAGRASLYRRSPGGTAWNLSASLSLASPRANEVLGASVSLQGGVLAVGSPGAMVGASVYGTAHAFRVDTDCDTDSVPDEIELLLGAVDCNLNGVPDSCDPDLNGNGTPDDCECFGDLTSDGFVSAGDLVVILSAWGSVGDNPADLTGDRLVNSADIALLLGAWGQCP